MRKIATLGARVLRSNFGRGARPFKLTLIVTYVCDTRCRMCNIWQQPKAGVMTLPEVARFFERNPHFSWINLSGGEIWTRPDAAELVETAIRASPDLYLLDFPTTGQATDVIAAGVERALSTALPKLLVTVSLDGPREVHEDIRGRTGAWDRAVETFRRLRTLRSSRFDVFLGVTLSAFNQGALLPTMAAVRSVLPDVTARDFHVNVAQVSAHYYANEGMPPTQGECLADVARFLAEKGHSFHPVGWLERRYQQLSAEFIASGRTPLPCRALASSVFVDARWNVYPCSMWDRPLGNLRALDFDLAGLWKGKDTLAARAEIVAGRCPHCWTPCEAYQTILGNLLRAGP
jgi:MoaA/NifB/PqqE/SkfB family radical SAM enzyme